MVPSNIVTPIIEVVEHDYDALEEGIIESVSPKPIVPSLAQPSIDSTDYYEESRLGHLMPDDVLAIPIVLKPEADNIPRAEVPYPGLVPETGEDGRVRWGAREINRTRDYIADIKARIKPILPVTEGGTGATEKLQAKVNLGITSSKSAPSGGQEGDIWLQLD